jgi:hypothetical protein
MPSTTMLRFQALSILLRRSSVSSRKKKVSADNGKHRQITFIRFFKELEKQHLEEVCPLYTFFRFTQHFKEDNSTCSI